MGVGVKLTEFSKSAGCAAKIGPGVLAGRRRIFMNGR